MSHLRPLLLATFLGGCAGEGLRASPVSLDSVTPAEFSARGGTQLTLKGEGFTPETVVSLGGVRATPHLVSSSVLTLTAPPMWAGPTQVVAGDVAQKVDVLPLELKFVEAPPLDAVGPITGLAARDFDQDDDVDLMVCGPTGPCRLLLNDGRGNFEPRFPLPVDAGASDAGAPDAGKKDAGTVDAGPVDAGPPTLNAFAAARLLAANDFDGDGDDDLLVERRDGGVFTFACLGHGDFGPAVRAIEPIVVDAGPLPLQPLTAWLVADLDRDGTPDLVSAGATPQLGPFRVDRAGTIFTPSLQPWTVSAFAAADVDGDQQLDLVIASTGGDGTTLRLFLNHQGTFSEVAGGLPSPAGGPWAALAAGDVDGDGAIDLVVVGPGQDRLLLNDGKGHFFDATASNLPVDGAKGTSVLLVDLDRDRDLDLLIGNASAAMRVYVNDGSGKFLDRTPALPFRSDTVTAVQAVNLDGDGDLDVVAVTGTAVRLNFSVETR